MQVCVTLYVSVEDVSFASLIIQQEVNGYACLWTCVITDVCMCLVSDLCACGRVYVCAFGRLSLRTYTSISVNLHLCVCVYLQTCVSVCLQTCVNRKKIDRNHLILYQILHDI